MDRRSVRIEHTIDDIYGRPSNDNSARVSTSSSASTSTNTSRWSGNHGRNYEESLAANSIGGTSISANTSPYDISPGEDSPYCEVRGAVSNRDDPSMPTLTFRVVLLGLVFSTAISFVNQFFWFRASPVIIGTMVVQVVVFPLAKLLEFTLPRHQLSTFGWKWSLNPGPFSMKEHVLICIFCSVGAGTMYATDIVVVKKYYYHSDLGRIGAMLLMMSSQMIGYGLAGVGRRFLVEPAAMIWPSTLASVILFRTFHPRCDIWSDKDEQQQQQSQQQQPQQQRQQQILPDQTLHRKQSSAATSIAGSTTLTLRSTPTLVPDPPPPPAGNTSLSRHRIFWIVTAAAFIWAWIPGFFFTMLSMLSILCMADRDSILYAQLSSGQFGLALLNIPLDWTTITGFLGSPIVTPFWAVCNVFFGFVLIMWVATPLAYYVFNTWSSQSMPIYFWKVFDKHGDPYHTERVMSGFGVENATAAVMSKHGVALNVTAYDQYSPVRMPFQFVYTYMFGFASVTAALSHVALFHGPQLLATMRRITPTTGDSNNNSDSSDSNSVDSRQSSQQYNPPCLERFEGKPDIHAKLMRQYPSIPAWWFAVLYLGMVAMGIATCEVYDLGVRWYMFLLAMVMPLVFIIPAGVILAVTNQQLGLNILSELIFGYINPGNAIGNVAFKGYCFNSLSQALVLLSIFKLAHYVKLPPRHVLICMVAGCIVAIVVQVNVAYWVLENVRGVCVEGTGSLWNCGGAGTFYSASIIFGAIGPHRVFNEQSYSVALHGFWIGLVLPVPVYLAVRRLATLANRSVRCAKNAVSDGERYTADTKARRYQQIASWISNIHIPAILSAAQVLPPMPPSGFVGWFVVGFIVNYCLKRWQPMIWQRHAFSVSAALDLGTVVAGVVIYFAVVSRGVELKWFGNEPSCRNELKPLVQAEPSVPTAATNTARTVVLEPILP